MGGSGGGWMKIFKFPRFPRPILLFSLGKRQEKGRMGQKRHRGKLGVEYYRCIDLGHPLPHEHLGEPASPSGSGSREP